MENRTQMNWLSGPAGLLFIVLIAFTVQVNAQDRYIGLGSLGNFYFGDIFSINTDGTNVQQLFQFDLNNTGGIPAGNLIMHNGLLYGTAQSGAPNWHNLGYTYGVLYSFDPSTNIQTVLYGFTGGSDGSYTNVQNQSAGGQLTEYPNGKLYGAASGGGVNNCGTIFSWDPATSTFSKLYDLPFGSIVGGPLTLFNYKLYGTSNYGGANQSGFLFSFDPRTNIFTDLYDFGQSPQLYTTMVGYQNKLYGVAQGAGPYREGIIFSYDPVSGKVAPVYSFDGTHGGNPYQIMVYQNKFYGTAQNGGANGNNGAPGVLFSFDPASGKYTDLHDNSNSGDAFYQGFVIDSSGKMNGTIGAGKFFQFDLNSNAYSEVPLANAGPINGLVYVPGNGGTTAQTLNFNSIPAKTYGDPDFSGGATVSSGLPISYSSSDLNVAWTNGDQIHIVGAGTCTITATQQGNSVYAPAIATQTLTVGKASLLITAGDTVKYQYRPLPAFTLTYTGFVYGDTVSSLLTPPTATTTADANSPQGQYPIIPAGAASGNYTITYQNGVLTITGQAQNIQFTDTSKTYGDSDFATATVNTGLPLTYASSNPAVAIITPGGKIHITGAGVDTITISQAGNSSYGFTSLSTVLTVLPATLSIKVNNDTSVYQGPAPVFSATFTGLVNGDTPDSLQTAFSSPGTDPKAVPGVYIIFATAIRPKDSVNYTIISNESGRLLIVPQGGDKNKLQAWFSSPGSLQVSLFVTNQTSIGHHVTLQLFDAAGRPCTNTEVVLNWGYNRYAIPAAGLPPGVYIIRLWGDTIQSLSQTITKLQ